MNNYMVIKWITWKKWTDSYKSSVFQDGILKEIDITNNPITSTEIEAMINNFPKNKSLGPDGFTGEFYKTIREELMAILLKLFQKVAKEVTLPNSFYKATVTLISKPDKDNTQKRKPQANIIDEHRCKTLNRILANRIQQHIKKLIHHDPSWVYPRDARILQCTEINQCDTPY